QVTVAVLAGSKLWRVCRCGEHLGRETCGNLVAQDTELFVFLPNAQSNEQLKCHIPRIALAAKANLLHQLQRLSFSFVELTVQSQPFEEIEVALTSRRRW